MIDCGAQIYVTDTLPFKPHGRVIALGLFDGLHMGHIDIIKKTVRLSAAHNLTPMVQTFTGLVKTPGGDLYTTEERCEIMSSLGASEILVLPFPDVKEMPGGKFFDDVLYMRAGAECLVCGDDYTFGKDGAGDIKLLKDLAKSKDVGVKVVPQVEDAGRRISSTWIKELLGQGDVKKVASLCDGRFYFYTGTVVKGKQMGREMGFPTANIRVNKFCARRGVYASKLTLGNRTLFGVTNIGRRPTLESNAQDDVAETFIFDFDEDIYGAKIKVELLDFLRPETIFKSKDELIAAVSENKANARQIVRDLGLT